MKVVFMGTPAFAVPALEALAAGHDVAAVYTAPDRPAGRGLTLRPSEVSVAAERLGLTIEQPESLRGRGVLERLAGYAPDVVAVAAYGLLLPPDVLALPKFGCVNIHPSLLPRHRGAAPIERALLEGDEETGVCIMRMDAGLDTGPVASCTSVPVDDADSATLGATLADIGARDLMVVLDGLEKGTTVWTPQGPEGVTYAAKMSAADVALEPGLTVVQALRRVRASSRTAPARAVVAGRPVVVLRASASGATLAQGRVGSADGLLLGLSDGALRVERLVQAGKREMDAADFVRGARLAADSVWGGAA